MKTPTLVASLLALSITCIAGNFTSKPIPEEKNKKESAGFWHHTGEFHLAPSADYYIYKQGSFLQNPKPYEFHLPLLGFDIGGQYMYRPAEVFAISAGFGFRMQGRYGRYSEYYLGEKYVNERSIQYWGSLNIPVELHLFKRMKKCTFEFATGPRFNLPVVDIRETDMYNPDGEKTGMNKLSDTSTPEEMREYSSLGWTLSMGGEIHLFNYGDLFIGPQIGFSNLVSFNERMRDADKLYGKQFNCSLGLKVGFRFHCETTPGY